MLEKRVSPKRGLGVIGEKGKIFVFYAPKRATGSGLKIAESSNGYSFLPASKKVSVFRKGLFKRKADISGCGDFSFTKLGKNKYFLLCRYARGRQKYLIGAVSQDLLKWRETGSFFNLKEPGTVVPEFQHDDQQVMYWGEKNIKIAFSRDLKKWNSSRGSLLKPRKSAFDNNLIKPAAAFLRKEGIVLFYYARDKKGKYSLGLALFSKNDPKKIIWRSKSPLWKQSGELKKDDIKPVGIASLKGKLVSYWENSQGEFFSLTLPRVWYPEPEEEKKEEKKDLKMRKSKRNPIVEPKKNNKWERDGTFNPTAMRQKGKSYVLYRALGPNFLSSVGCAVTSDGTNIEERWEEPVYKARESFEGGTGPIDPKEAVKYMSGGGCGGCEDARIVEIEGRYYLTYVAYDGAHPPRVAISSISVEDFLNKRFENWTKPVLISRPGVIDKNACILPEKVRGKYVIFHRIYPNILVDYVDSLDFDGKTFLKNEFYIPPRPLMWDSKKVGVGPSPIKTNEGWLTIYQSVGRQDPGRYKIGAMLLDLEDPTKIVCRSSEPIIEPVEWYENDGHKSGVVYPCGATVQEDNLYVYYGGADKFSCVATARLSNFLKQLVESNTPKLKKVTLV